MRISRVCSARSGRKRTLRNRACAVGDADQLQGGPSRHRALDQLPGRARKGGCGMIVTEVIAVDPAALTAPLSPVTTRRTRTASGARGRRSRRGRMPYRCGTRGASGLGQVWSPKGISDQPDAYSWTVPHRDHRRAAASDREYVSVAPASKLRLRRRGCEAHGYLISQILAWSTSAPTRTAARWKIACASSRRFAAIGRPAAMTS